MMPCNANKNKAHKKDQKKGNRKCNKLTIIMCVSVPDFMERTAGKAATRSMRGRGKKIKVSKAKVKTRAAAVPVFRRLNSEKGTRRDA